MYRGHGHEKLSEPNQLIDADPVHFGSAIVVRVI